MAVQNSHFVVLIQTVIYLLNKSTRWQEIANWICICI